MTARTKAAVLVICILCIADGMAWRRVLGGGAMTPVYYALDVGQGDATVIRLPGGATIMTDAGPDDSVVNALGNALPGILRIDVAIISHPQLDHFNGYNFLIDHYTIGAFIINGRNDSATVAQWPQLIQKIRAKHIPLIVLGAGDSIHYASNTITMLSPNHEFRQSAELNDTGFVEYVKTSDWTALLMADTGTNIEEYLFKKKFPIDILKVGHHGSKYSTGEKFLSFITPKIATISDGANNHYGHPGVETLKRLKIAGVQVLRTDRQGTISISRRGKSFAVATERPGN